MFKDMAQALNRALDNLEAGAVFYEGRLAANTGKKQNSLQNSRLTMDALIRVSVLDENGLYPWESEADSAASTAADTAADIAADAVAQLALLRDGLNWRFCVAYDLCLALLEKQKIQPDKYFRQWGVYRDKRAEAAGDEILPVIRSFLNEAKLLPF
jgi:hypothetical protein